jgi:beta-galactosidase
MGRVNFVRAPSTLDNQRKGIIGSVTLNGQSLTDWTISPVDLAEAKRIGESKTFWRPVPAAASVPAIFKFNLDIESSPQDTFLDMTGWGRGVAFVNGFNLGRYWPSAGPLQTLYVPAPVLKEGTNIIVLFELHSIQPSIKFATQHVVGGKATSNDL